jgi:uncharacterized damage-inducible protein DinB/shikimate kinase
MPRILITGMSGTGKSTVVAELAARGYHAIDLDDAPYSGWIPADGNPTGHKPGHDWTWDEAEVEALLASDASRALIVSGCAPNMAHFLDKFDHIVLLAAPIETILERLATRTNNVYGKRPEEVERVRANMAEIEPRLRAIATEEIDSSLPLSEVVERIADLADAEAWASTSLPPTTMIRMKTAAPALQTFVDGWQDYQSLLLDALRPLAAEQMALRPAPHQWTLWQIASHMAGVRMYWFHDILRVGDAALRDMFRVEQTTVPGLTLEVAGWEDDEAHPRAAAEIVDAFEQTWALMAEYIARWTAADLAVVVERWRRDGAVKLRSREWVIWHLMEHDLHHGGEISSILGSHGLAALDL